MNKQTVRCAIVGAGLVVGDLHLPALRGLPQVEVAAVCETDPLRARRFQDRILGSRVYASLDELLSGSDRIDFVDIATPAQTHFELARQALEAGLHVLIEKPLALTAKQGAELAALARARGRKLCVLQTYRFRTPMLRADAALSAGTLGTLSKINVTARWQYDLFEDRKSWDWADKRTRLLLYELGVHYVDIAVHVGGPVQTILGFDAVTDPESGAVTGLSALLEHETGSVSVLDFAVLASSQFIRIELFGSKSDASIKLWPESFVSRRGIINPVKEIKAEVRRTADFIAQNVADRLGRAGVKRRALPHYRVMSAFVDAIMQPELDVPVSADSAVHTLEVLDALHDRIIASPIPSFADDRELPLVRAS
jgi:predicted dehydrogenase